MNSHKSTTKRTPGIAVIGVLLASLPGATAPAHVNLHTAIRRRVVSHFFLLSLVAFCAGITTSAQAAFDDITTIETVDFDRFAQGIVDRLQGHVIGFGYAIARNGAVVRSDAGGDRRLEQDGGARHFTRHTMAQTASAAKTITAAAVIKALHANDIQVDDLVLPYLPACWEKGEGVAQSLTFRDLLGHHSGLVEASRSYCSSNPLDCMADVIRQGRIFDMGDDNYEYQNVNYALMRVILPFVLSPDEMHGAFNALSCSDRGGQLNELVSGRFRDYVLGQVLAPLGVTASFYPQGDGLMNFAYGYNNADPRQQGIAPRADFYLRAGAGRLAISAVGYARFLSALDAGLIVPKSLADEMKGVAGDRMGFDRAISGTLGSYVWKNGGCPNFCATLAMVFPNGVQAYVAINSGNNTYSEVHGGLDTVLRDAFDEALL